MTHRRHSFLHAIAKWTSEVTKLVRERGCYLGIREREGRWEICHFSGVHRVLDVKPLAPYLSKIMPIV